MLCIVCYCFSKLSLNNTRLEWQIKDKILDYSRMGIFQKHQIFRIWLIWILGSGLFLEFKNVANFDMSKFSSVYIKIIPVVHTADLFICLHVLVLHSGKCTFIRNVAG